MGNLTPGAHAANDPGPSAASRRPPDSGIGDAASFVRIAPTLALMAGIYRLSRQGGPKSERFRAYLERVQQAWGLVAYNPMAGQAALDAVERLLALDAESLAHAAATRMAWACAKHDEITLAVVIRSQGMWTDRVATDADYRAWAGRHPTGFGLVNLWSGDQIAAEDVEREAAVETVRVMWTARHGSARTVREVLAREGLAYALTTAVAGIGDPFGGAPTATDIEAVSGALDVLADAGEPSEVIGVLLGDRVATTMGWMPLGIPEHAGYRWAIDQAAGIVRALGASGALHAAPSEGLLGARPGADASPHPAKRVDPA